MALITCPECGGTASSLAKKCPHCGYPFAPKTRKTKEEVTVDNEPAPVVEPAPVQNPNPAPAFEPETAAGPQPNQSLFINLLRTSAITYTAYLALIIILVISAASTASSGSPSAPVFGHIIKWLYYFFFAILAGTAIMFGITHKGQSQSSLVGSMLLLVYVVLSIVMIIIGHSVNAMNITDTLIDSVFTLFLIRPIVLAGGFVAVARNYNNNGLKIRSMILMVLAFVNMIALLIIRNSHNTDSVSGAGVVVGIGLLAFSILETVFFYRWLAEEKKSCE